MINEPNIDAINAELQQIADEELYRKRIDARDDDYFFTSLDGGKIYATTKAIGDSGSKLSEKNDPSAPY